MPNAIKSATTVSNGVIDRNDFLIAVDTSLSYGPTTSTNFWSGIVPSVGGYVVYAQKESQGPSIRTASNDTELITIAKQYGGTSIVTVTDALNFFNGQSNYMVTNLDYPNIVTSGLTLMLDGGFTPSYPRTGTVWNDLSGNAFFDTLVNGPTYSSSNEGNIVFDGVDDYSYINSSGFFSISVNNLFADVGYAFTVCAWFKFPVTPSGVRAGNQSFGIVGQSGGIGGAETFTLYVAGDNTYGNFTNCLVIGCRGSKTQISPSTVNTGLWNYATVTWNGSNGTTYFNGGNATSLNVGTAVIQTGYYLGVGVTGYNGILNNIPQYFEGNIGVVQIYNRALSATEILQNYNAQKTRFGL